MSESGANRASASPILVPSSVMEGGDDDAELLPSKEQEEKKAKEVDEAKKKKEAEEKKNLVSYRKLFFFADRRDKLWMLVASICAIANGLIMPLFSFIFGELFDNFNDSLSVEDNVRPQLYWFIGLGVATGILSYVSMFGWMYTSERQTKAMREAFMRAILRQDMSWFDAHDAGELSTRLAADTLEYNKATGEKISSGFFNLFTFVGGLGLGLYKGWQLTLLILGMTPFLGFAGAMFATLMAEVTNETQKGYSKAGSVADETFSAIKTVQAFAAEQKQRSRYDAFLDYARKYEIKRGFSLGNTLGFTMMILFSAYGLSMWFGGWLIRHHITNADGDPYTGGDVTAVFFGVLFGAMSLGPVGQSLQAVSSGRAAAARLFEIIDRVPAIDVQSTKGKKLDVWKSNISIENVTFAYPTRKEAPIFSGFTIQIKAGQVVALVGESGSGKSTVSGLVQRFYDPDAGRIMVDGVDLKELNVGWWRLNVGVVSQEPVLFDATVEENIRYGHPDATFEQIQAAARAANAEEFVERLPGKYTYRVGQNGSLLSGGQKQRLAIARALVKNPKVLILDEATSALDNKSEAEVQRALDKVMREHTTIIIAHRLSTIMKADVIFVLGRGESFEQGTRLIEQGTHQELMEQGGVYTRLVSAQDASAPHGATEEKDLSANDRKASELAMPAGMTRQVSANKTAGGTHTPLTTPGGGGTRKLDTLAVKETEEEKKKRIAEEKKLADSEQVPNVPFSRVTNIMQGNVFYLILGSIASICIGGAQPVWAILFADLTAIYYETDYSVMRQKSMERALFFVAMGAGLWIASVTESVCFAITGERLTFYLRSQAYNSLLYQEIGWFDDLRHTPRTLATRLQIDASLVHTAVTKRASSLLQMFSALAVGLLISFYYGWKLALVVLSILPVLMISGVMQMKFFSGFTDETNKAFETAGRIASEACANIRTVSSFNAEKSVMQKFSEALVPPLISGIKKAHVAGIGFGFSQLSFFMAYALTFWYGAKLVDDGELSFGDMLKVIFGIVMSSFQVGTAAAFLPDMTAARAATNHIFHLIDRKSAIDASSNEGEKPVIATGAVNLDNVKFAYPIHADTTILDRLSLAVKGGQTVALVGPSGCGKSTVVSLLLRFYDILSGKLAVDGNDTKSMNVAHLRQHLGLVSQEPVLFDGSIEENIVYGRPNATHEEVVAAAQAANIHEFITKKLPDQYKTNVGVGGSKLSGGQKQRVAIARALIRQPRILLLDEATSALDSQSERSVQVALDKLMSSHDRTVIVIAHRLSTIRNADQIAVLNRGTVAELGTHDELMEKKGLYAALVRTTGKQKVDSSALREVLSAESVSASDLDLTSSASLPIAARASDNSTGAPPAYSEHT